MNRRYYFGALCMGILFMLVLTSCSSKKNNMETEEKLTIFTTVYPLQFLIEKIGDKHVQVQSVYPPGADEHTFEPTQKTMMKIADADLLIYIGLGLEGFVEQSKNVFKNQQVDLLAAGEKLDLEDNHKTVDNEQHQNETEHKHGDIDPHVWLNPIYMKEMAKSITETLSKRMPEKRSLFEENYELITSQLEELDAKFATLIETSKRKEMIVAHAAFGYWEKRYGLKQIPIAGISTTDEPSPRQLKEIIETIKKKNIRYLLLEQNVNTKMTDIVRSETDTKVLTIHNLAVLSENEIDQNEDYFSLMKQNLYTLKTVLNE